MSYHTISLWTADEWTDRLETTAREKFVPLILENGASGVRMVRTGDTSFAVITDYADKAAADAAQERMANIRTQASDEMTISMDDRYVGETFAQG